MYTSKKFKVRPFNDIKKDIETLARYYNGAKRLFIADGNAMVLSFSKLKEILTEINVHFTRLQRVSAYALPKDIIPKTDDELKTLRALGLKLLYIGIETGDDTLLKIIDKGETYESTLEGIKKAHKAGIDTSIMIINGLGGKEYSEDHALNSAKIISELSPKFLSTLTLSLPYGQKHYEKRLGKAFHQQTLKELFLELKLFIENLHVSHVIFRSNHVSNNLNLEGTLPKDKDKLLQQLEEAVHRTPDDMMPVAPDFL